MNNFAKSILFSVSIIMLLIAGCTNSDNADAFSSLINKKDGMFRGAYFNSNIDNIKNNETAKLIRADENSLEYYIISGQKDSLNVLYEFDQNGLYFINVISSMKTPESANDFYNKLINHYKGIYGDGEEVEPKLYHWEIEKEPKGFLEIDARDVDTYKEVIIDFSAY